MDLKKINELKLKIHFEKQVPHWWRVAYLIPIDRYDDIIKDSSRILEGKDSVFNKIIQEHVQAYITKGVKPPQQIEAPILNIAEDILVGRDPVIRAGDYIAIQTYIKANKKLGK